MLARSGCGNWTADVDASHLGARLQILPGEVALVLGLELVVQRLRVVVVDQNVALARCQLVVVLEDELVPTRGYFRTNIEQGAIKHEVPLGCPPETNTFRTLKSNKIIVNTFRRDSRDEDDIHDAHFRPVLSRTGVRLAFLIPGAIAMFAGLDAALLLLSLPAPLTFERFPVVHGPLLVFGFIGTVIALERAVAIRKWWAFGSPAAFGLASFLMLSPLPLVLGICLGEVGDGPMES